MATKKNITKEDIVNATTKLISTKNVENISLQDIANAVGISKGTLFYYYTSKDYIFLDIAKNYLDNLADDFITWINDTNKDTSLSRMTKYVIEFGARKNNRGKLHIYLVNRAISGDDKINELFRDSYSKWKIMLQEKFAERLSKEDSEIYTNTILVIIDGLIVQDLVGIKNINIKDMTKLIK